MGDKHNSSSILFHQYSKASRLGRSRKLLGSSISRMLYLPISILASNSLIISPPLKTDSLLPISFYTKPKEARTERISDTLRIVLITASIFMKGASLTISGLLPPGGFVIFVVCCAIMGFSLTLYSGVQTALFQEKFKPEYLGRVFSLTGSIMSLAMPVGLIISGFFADRIGVNHWFLISGILVIGIAVIFPLVTEVRKLD